MTKVSYLVVAYRSNDHIRALLDSIEQQSGEFEKEIVVVDNYPPENCSEQVACRKNLRYILNKTNSGYTKGVDQAITASSGDYLFLLNPDVKLFDDCTAQLLAETKVKEDVVAAAPQLLNEDGTIQSSVRNFPTFATLIYEHFGLAKAFPQSARFGRWRNTFFNHQILADVEQPMASALLIKRSAVEKIGAMDEQFFVFFSDVDYCKRIVESGWRIRFVPTAKAYHKIGGSTRQEGTWLVRDSHSGFYRYLRKHELNGVRALLRPIAATLLWTSGAIRIALKRITRRSF